VGGKPELIYNECWGVVELPASVGGGFAMSCAAGIEECGTKVNNASLYAECIAGGGWAGTPAIAHKAGVWILTLFRVDAEGNEFWRLAKSYKKNTDTFTINGASSSAAEWPLLTKDGGIALVTDEVFGCGILKFSALGDAPLSQPAVVR